MPCAEPTLRPPHLLQIEDNPGDAQLLAETLRDLPGGFTIDVVPNAVRAIEHLHQAGQNRRLAMPDAILLDLELPVMGGLTFLRVLSKHHDWARIPVVVLTSSTLRAQVEEAQRLGAASYQVKPSTYEGYLALARRLTRLPLIPPAAAPEGMPTRSAP